MFIKKIGGSSILLLLAVIVVISCKKANQTRIQASWSAKFPTSIPFNVRNNERNLGNLVVNSSFENGKVYYEEGTVKSYDINGWKKVGKNIKWVNTNNGMFDSSEVYQGNYAIKIERTKADETEEIGEGIISDYIKVIPGNFSFNLFLKLEDISPNQARIGTKMHDAINIRLQFYDKNKIEISGTELDIFNNRKIDNTFKSFSLSNFWEIEKLDWCQIHGKTANYPFFDGDIPDNSRYVKIFIGLKGTGKMWIDDVDLRYTDENFTMLERMKPYFDSSYFSNELVFPQPKHLKKYSPIKFFDVDSSIFPIIIIPKEANQHIKESANELKSFLSSLIPDHSDEDEKDVSIVRSIDLNKVSKSQLIISLGETELYTTFKSDLPDSALKMHQEAYYIINSKSEDNLLFINGLSNNSLSNALYTLKQLFNSIESLLYSADIIDYSDFQERAFLLHEYKGDIINLNQKLDLLYKYKFNKAYFEWYGADHEKYYTFESFNEVSGNKYSLTLDLDNLSIKNRNIFNDFKSKGLGYNSIESILFASNSTTSDNSLQSKHIEQLNGISNYVHMNKLPVNIEFLPPWSSLDVIDKGHGIGELYYYDINKKLSKDISLYWTGCAFYSKKIDNAEYFRINKITGSSPILLDNSLLINNSRFKDESIRNYFAGKIRTLSIFEPFNLQTFDSFKQQSKTKKVIVNTKELSELHMISLLTASNYYWNTSSYNADKSLWIVLNKLYGRDNAINLIYFNEAYFGLKEICQRIILNGVHFKNLRMGKLFEDELEKVYTELELSLNNENLLIEIKALKDEFLESYKDLINESK